MDASALPPLSTVELYSSDSMTPGLSLGIAAAASQSSTATKLRQQLSREEWNKFQPLIRRLYMVENRKFPEVADFLAKSHGFRPTKKQFSSKIAEWGFKKNSNKKERRALLQNLAAVEGDSVFDTAGRKHKREKLERWKYELKRETLGNPQPLHASADSEILQARMDSELAPEPSGSTDTQFPEPLIPMEVDIATPPVEAEGKSKVWIKDDEEFRYWPFARWANADVQGSPKLTRLFADLTLETKGLPDDIESLALPAPSIEPTTPAAREYIECCELTKVLSEGDGSSLSWGDGFCFSDSEAGLVVVPAQSRPPPNPFKFTNSDVLFPAQIWISQPPPSPFDELYVFPTQTLRHTNRRQKFETILHSQRMDELLFAGKLEQLKRAGFDECHPAVSELTKRLAQAFYVQGKVKQAETLLRKLLSVQQDMDRIQSMEVLYLQIDLIDSLCHRGRVFEAKKLHEKVHAAIVKTFPTQHHLLQQSLVSMIIILDQMKENGEQETMSRQLVQINLAQLGPKHPDTIGAMSRLAISMRLRRRYIESEKLQRIAVKLSYEVHTVDYGVICWSFMDLARIFEDQAYFEDAIKYYLLAAERAREFLGDEHTTTMACNRSIGRTLRRKGFIRESEELLFATTKLQTKALGEDHVETLWTMFELGCTLCESDKDQEGAGALWLEKCFQKGLDIFEPKHSLTIYSCDSLGICYERQGRYDDALALYHKLLNNVRDAEGAEDPTISKIQGWIDKVHEFIEEERG